MAFGASLAGPFVFDDFSLLNDPAVASRSGWWQCFRFLQTRPLTWFSFWASYQFGGENPIAYHAVSLMLHIAVLALLWDVLRKLIPERAAVIAAALFAVHPLVVEPVAYVFARGALLATLFSLLAIRSWIADRSGIAVVWFTVAMLAKEECAALPVFLIMLDFARGKELRRRPIAALLTIALLMRVRVILAAASVTGSQAGSQAGISPLRYLAAQGQVILRYLRMLIVPWGFSIDYSSTLPPLALALAACAAVIALAMVASLRFRNLGPGFWFLAGLVLLSPSSSIFPAADLANDRRMYLPLIGFSACAGLLLKRLDWRVLAAASVVLIAITMRYDTLWRSPEALWTNAMHAAPEKVRPRLQLARLAPPAQGLEILREAQQLAPENAEISMEQGRILLENNRPAEALAAFGKAMALSPGDARPVNNRGAALAAIGQPDAARADFLRAVALDPCLFDGRVNLARMGIQWRAPDNCRYTDKQQQILVRATGP